jgi:hypothetical protein
MQVEMRIWMRTIGIPVMKTKRHAGCEYAVSDRKLRINTCIDTRRVLNENGAHYLFQGFLVCCYLKVCSEVRTFGGKG